MYGCGLRIKTNVIFNNILQISLYSIYIRSSLPRKRSYGFVTPSCPTNDEPLRTSALEAIFKESYILRNLLLQGNGGRGAYNWREIWVRNISTKKMCY